MDNKKVIFAIAAAVIVVAAAIGIGVFAMNNGGGGGNAKDSIKGDVAEGDYYVMDIELSMSSGNINSTQTTKTYILDGFFAYGTQPGGTERITIPLGSFDCNKTSLTDSEGNTYTFWNDVTTGWMIKEEKRDSGNNLLISVEPKSMFGFDIGKDRANQSFEANYRVEYNYKMLAGAYGMAVGSMQYYVDRVVSATDVMVTQSIAVNVDKGNHRLEIATIFGDTITYKDGLGQDTKEGFMSYISFAEFKKDISSIGSVKTISKTDKTVDTAFGKRDVTVEKIEITEMEGKITYVVTHSGDVIYSVEIDGFSQSLNMDIKGSIVIVDTSMFA